MSYISNGALVADKILGSSVRQVFVENTVKSLGLVLVAIDAVFDLLGGVAGELL